jgi:hypothetical protein
MAGSEISLLNAPYATASQRRSFGSIALFDP